MIRTPLFTSLLSVAISLAVTHQVSIAEDTKTAKPTGDAEILVKGATLIELWNEGEFTEGAACSQNGTIFFSDIEFGPDGKGRILAYSPRTGKTKVVAPQSGQSNGLMFNRKNELLAVCGANNGHQALCKVSKNGTVTPIVSKYMGKTFNAPNDITIHPNGNIYFSDPRYVGHEPIELDQMSVYLYVPETKVLKRATTDIEKPNGVGLSPDGKTLYVAETNNGSTDVTKQDPNTKIGRMTLNSFPINEDGTLGKKRVLVDFGPNGGTDGMTVDSKGNIYAAVRDKTRFGIRVFSPDGKERAFIPTPELPTNCCFGDGKEISTLYITAGTGLYKIAVKIPGFHPARATVK